MRFIRIEMVLPWLAGVVVGVCGAFGILGVTGNLGPLEADTYIVAGSILSNGDCEQLIKAWSQFPDSEYARSQLDFQGTLIAMHECPSKNWWGFEVRGRNEAVAHLWTEIRPIWHYGVVPQLGASVRMGSYLQRFPAGYTYRVETIKTKDSGDLP